MGGGNAEHFPDEYPGHEEHRYGELGGELVDALWCLLDSISEPLRPDQCDQETDTHNTLWAMTEMELFITCLRPDARVSIEERFDLDSALTAARAALPISEAEAGWLRAGEFDFENEVIGFDDSNTYAEHVASLPKHREGEIVAGGRWVPVSTEELENRWAAWRKQDGSFAGQGTLDLAREALRTAIQIMEPAHTLPDSYLELRAAGGH